MAFLNATFEYLDFDGEGYSRAIRDYYHFKMITAIRDFLRVAVPRVPVITGMARGSFLNLGRAVNFKVPIVPHPKHRKDKYYHRPGSAGEPKRASTAAKKYTSYKIPRRGAKEKMVFEFDARTMHFNLEEFIGVKSPSAPWQSLEFGMKAFMDRISETDEFPIMAEYITKVRLSVGRGSGITEERIPPIRRQLTRRIT